jgi:hypothetical protein
MRPPEFDFTVTPVAADKELLVFGLHFDSIWVMLPTCFVGIFGASWPEDIVTFCFRAEIIKHLGRIEIKVV